MAGLRDEIVLVWFPLFDKDRGGGPTVPGRRVVRIWCCRRESRVVLPVEGAAK